MTRWELERGKVLLAEVLAEQKGGRRSGADAPRDEKATYLGGGEVRDSTRS